MPLNRLILCRPLLLLPSVSSSVRVFSNESILRIRWPKYWSLSFSIDASNEYSGLISFRMDWLDLLAFQGTLESLLQLHSSKASVLWCSAFFLVQLTSMHDYWKNPYSPPKSCSLFGTSLPSQQSESPWGPKEITTARFLGPRLHPA